MSYLPSSPIDEQTFSARLGNVLSRRCSLARTWLISPKAAPKGIESAQEFLSAVGITCEVYEPLGGTPISACDGKTLEGECYAQGNVLLALNTTASFAISSPALRGADIVCERMGDAIAVGLARGVASRHPALQLWLEEALLAEEDVCRQLFESLDDVECSFRAASDAARAAAAYLACHPYVAHVHYPGLPGDPAFDAAARALHHGFGPYIDWSSIEAPEHLERIDCRGVSGAEATRALISRLEARLREFSPSR